ncbi:MAG: hypothetical protein A2V59_01605 [Armatimonadetes bacterium RBG_19FT_COMBO_69_19]|nr:MAG: hypothetical protein A2V59_01605 [Armatimonadetes bacterium RBG_19FT_COMBO_69_19]
MRLWLLVGLVLLLGSPPAQARVGDPLQVFTEGPVMNQLALNPQGQMALSGELSGRTLYRFVSEDGVITVDVVVRGGLIEQLVMYLPRDERRGFQVSMFLQDAVGSVIGAQKGMLAFRAAVVNGGETYLTFAGYTMRFTPLDRAMLRVLITR